MAFLVSGAVNVASRGLNAPPSASDPELAQRLDAVQQQYIDEAPQREAAQPRKSILRKRLQEQQLQRQAQDVYEAQEAQRRREELTARGPYPSLEEELGGPLPPDRRGRDLTSAPLPVRRVPTVEEPEREVAPESAAPPAYEPPTPQLRLTREWQSAPRGIPLPSMPGVETYTTFDGRSLIRLAGDEGPLQERMNARRDELMAMPVGYLNQEGSRYGLEKGFNKGKAIERILAEEERRALEGEPVAKSVLRKREPAPLPEAIEPPPAAYKPLPSEVAPTSRTPLDEDIRFAGHGIPSRPTTDLEPAPEKPAASVPLKKRIGMRSGSPSVQATDTTDERLSRWATGRLNEGGISEDEFFAEADRNFGGTRAEGKYGDSRAYDALERGVNSFLVSRTDPRVGAGEAKATVDSLERLTAQLPAHKSRTGNKDLLQQFSTPPAYAYVATWAATPTANDVVLEPSAGTGGLAVHALNAGARVYANEIDPARAALVGALPVEQVFREDAEFIGGSLKNKMPAPSVIVMNPPFSRAGHRLGAKKQVATDLKHIDSALQLLQPGGRLVAIVGAGLHGRGVGFDNWLTNLPYSVRADIEVGRDVYKGYGTSSQPGFS